ncbi:multidrug DMT transporter permease [Streptomyces olivaceoviridis]|uniref:multidrug DMT transporter permease n=1 Tax=Streptomyces olivaceoviridis TaxID=1921 RepID=UPI0036BB269C
MGPALASSGGGGTAGDYGSGALSGIGTGAGVAFLYRAMAQGRRMSVVVPVSDVGAVALPVLVGVAFLGERPAAIAWAGIAVAVPAGRTRGVVVPRRARSAAAPRRARSAVAPCRARTAVPPGR